MIELTPYLWSQVLGIIGTILMIIGTQCKNRSIIMSILSVSMGFYAGHYWLLGDATGMAMSSLSVVRYFISIWTTHKIWKIIFLSIIFGLFILTFHSWVISTLALIAGIFAVLGTFAKDTKQMRVLLFCGSLAWCIHGAILQSVIAVVTQIGNMISWIVSYSRYEIKKPQR